MLHLWVVAVMLWITVVFISIITGPLGDLSIKGLSDIQDPCSSAVYTSSCSCGSCGVDYLSSLQANISARESEISNFLSDVDKQVGRNITTRNGSSELDLLSYLSSTMSFKYPVPEEGENVDVCSKGNDSEVVVEYPRIEPTCVSIPETIPDLSAFYRDLIEVEDLINPSYASKIDYSSLSQVSLDIASNYSGISDYYNSPEFRWGRLDIQWAKDILNQLETVGNVMEDVIDFLGKINSIKSCDVGLFKVVCIKPCDIIPDLCFISLPTIQDIKNNIRSTISNGLPTFDICSTRNCNSPYPRSLKLTVPKDVTYSDLNISLDIAHLKIGALRNSIGSVLSGSSAPTVAPTSSPTSSPTIPIYPNSGVCPIGYREIGPFDEANSVLSPGRIRDYVGATRTYICDGSPLILDTFNRTLCMFFGGYSWDSMNYQLQGACSSYGLGGFEDILRVFWTCDVSSSYHRFEALCGSSFISGWYNLQSGSFSPSFGARRLQGFSSLCSGGSEAKNVSYKVPAPNLNCSISKCSIVDCGSLRTMNQINQNTASVLSALTPTAINFTLLSLNRPNSTKTINLSVPFNLTRPSIVVIPPLVPGVDISGIYYDVGDTGLFLPTFLGSFFVGLLVMGSYVRDRVYVMGDCRQISSFNYAVVIFQSLASGGVAYIVLLIMSSLISLTSCLSTATYNTSLSTGCAYTSREKEGCDSCCGELLVEVQRYYCTIQLNSDFSPLTQFYLLMYSYYLITAYPILLYFSYFVYEYTSYLGQRKLCGLEDQSGFSRFANINLIKITLIILRSVISLYPSSDSFIIRITCCLIIEGMLFSIRRSLDLIAKENLSISSFNS